MRHKDKEIFAYVTHNLGFSEIRGILLYDTLIPKIEEIGIKVNGPFRTCEPHIPWDKIKSATKPYQMARIWFEFYDEIETIKRELMSKSQMMAPILDGGRDVDNDVVYDIDYFSANEYGPIIALRTDVRHPTNDRVEGEIESDISKSNGKVCRSLDDWFRSLRSVYESLRKS